MFALFNCYQVLSSEDDLVYHLLQNLEIKKINDEKKAALAAQFAAESTLRRVHAAQKDDEMPPIEAIITPLEAELKLARLEVYSCSHAGSVTSLQSGVSFSYALAHELVSIYACLQFIIEFHEIY